MTTSATDTPSPELTLLINGLIHEDQIVACEQHSAAMADIVDGLRKDLSLDALSDAQIDHLYEMFDCSACEAIFEQIQAAGLSVDFGNHATVSDLIVTAVNPRGAPYDSALTRPAASLWAAADAVMSNLAYQCSMQLSPEDRVVRFSAAATAHHLREAGSLHYDIVAGHPRRADMCVEPRETLQWATNITRATPSRVCLDSSALHHHNVDLALLWRSGNCVILVDFAHPLVDVCKSRIGVLGATVEGQDDHIWRLLESIAEHIRHLSINGDPEDLVQAFRYALEQPDACTGAPTPRIRRLPQTSRRPPGE
jgi:hypothetical protein